MRHQRGSITIGILVALLAAASAVVVVVFVVVDAPAPPVSDRPSVRYVGVRAATPAAHVTGHELDVEIELEVTSRMPHMAPHVVVAARCAGATDDEDAFFMTLSGAQPGDRKIESVRLFRVRSFEAPPEQCELTLSLGEGATPPQRWCYQRGVTTAGACR